MRETLTSGAGSTSYWVTTGPAFQVVDADRDVEARELGRDDRGVAAVVHRGAALLGGDVLEDRDRRHHPAVVGFGGRCREVAGLCVGRRPNGSRHGRRESGPHRHQRARLPVSLVTRQLGRPSARRPRTARRLRYRPAAHRARSAWTRTSRTSGRCWGWPRGSASGRSAPASSGAPRFRRAPTSGSSTAVALATPTLVAFAAFPADARSASSARSGGRERGRDRTGPSAERRKRAARSGVSSMIRRPTTAPPARRTNAPGVVMRPLRIAGQEVPDPPTAHRWAEQLDQAQDRDEHQAAAEEPGRPGCRVATRPLDVPARARGARTAAATGHCRTTARSSRARDR